MKVAFVLSGSPNGLKYLDRNREKVGNTLKQYGWEVRVATFYSLALLQSYIDEFKNREIEDFIFYYTGHGDSSSNDGILTLKLHDKTPVDLNTLHNSYFSQLNPIRKAIILDACYSGNFEDRKFHDKTEYLCSSDFDEESYEDIREDGLELSYFSYYFCKALDNLEDVVTLERINEQYLEPNIGTQNSKYVSIDSKMVIVDKNHLAIKNSLFNKDSFSEKLEQDIKSNQSTEIEKPTSSILTPFFITFFILIILSKMLYPSLELIDTIYVFLILSFIFAKIFVSLRKKQRT